jgi:hypothetical protein
MDPYVKLAIDAGIAAAEINVAKKLGKPQRKELAVYLAEAQRRIGDMIVVLESTPTKKAVKSVKVKDDHADEVADSGTEG